SPSASTIHFVPLSRLVLPTARPPFSLEQNCRRGTFSSHRSSPSSSSPPSRARQASSQTPCSCHCCSRRQQVEGDGNSSGRNRQAAPVCRIHKISSKQARFGAGGRPGWSGRRLGLGNNGSISSHCSSVNSFRRRFMTEAQQPTRLTHKYLARGRTYF